MNRINKKSTCSRKNFFIRCDSTLHRDIYEIFQIFENKKQVICTVWEYWAGFTFLQIKIQYQKTLAKDLLPDSEGKKV